MEDWTISDRKGSSFVCRTDRGGGFVNRDLLLSGCVVGNCCQRPRLQG